MRFVGDAAGTPAGSLAQPPMLLDDNPRIRPRGTGLPNRI